jgi:hypothetical protein
LNWMEWIWIETDTSESCEHTTHTTTFYSRVLWIYLLFSIISCGSRLLDERISRIYWYVTLYWGVSWCKFCIFKDKHSKLFRFTLENICLSFCI